MAQSPEGAEKVAAQKAGVSVVVYRKKRKANLKWCSLCRKWHPTTEFGKDSSRYDGLTSSCSLSRNRWFRDHYLHRPRPAKGRRFVLPLDGNKKQARSRVNYLVSIGFLPNPNLVACLDCGHIGKGRRHEYDHCRGYAAKNHETVEAVCSKCHSARAFRRGEQGRKRKMNGK